SGKQTLVLHNPHDLELVVRLERTTLRDDALTAAQASSLALFRELFPGETLSPGQLVAVATTTFLVTALHDAEHLYAQLGDARAFAVVREHYRIIGEEVKRNGGAVVKTVGEGVLAAFQESEGAVRAALALPALLRENPLTAKLQ